ncbi:hypothetical protein A3A38_00950 [Candidatus Kaiserbacteria bacterium RIFCSPLOWO2_01_FULL_53_17]|uniref:Cell shape-determining protein MreC n=1 Tax=Candidatus Kaiserbacteria bacterium RIFCSPLOWO2_01_FULL_53_17 TaxID=1798511 RepID=A0A1F6EI81_9BACT|nr:MAG: hypothetical protein A3A38_00950 [Candidatus Kaiserbacteria bacterium RIFCSPLOWO2_01_FULL_53_17]
MKNLYPQNEPPLFAAFIAVLIVAGSIFGIDRLSGGVVRGYAREGGGAFWALANGATALVTESGALSGRRALEEENAALEGEIARRDESLTRFEALEDENAALREMANLAANDPGIAASVLSSLWSSPYGTFSIGVGSEEGVDEGSVVLTPGGFVLGIVTDVAAHTSLVEALFAPGNEVELTTNDIAFTAEGQGGGNARARVPRDAAVEARAVVLVPELASRPAGVVGAVESASSSAFTSVYIHLPVNVSVLRYVYVVTP